jgi:hypothetical protein
MEDVKNAAWIATIAGSHPTNEHPKKDVGEEVIRASKEDANMRRREGQVRQIPVMSARCAVSQQAKLGMCKKLPAWSTTTWAPHRREALTSRRVQLQAPSRLYSSAGFAGM